MAIGIAQVLAQIDLSAIQGSFSITFVKEKGELRTIKRAQKGHKPNYAAAPTEGSKFKYRIKEKGVVIVGDLDALSEKDRFRTIKISRIIKFNNIPVHH
jgi:hypothetical protein